MEKSKMRVWQLQEAKAKLSQLVNDSKKEPQIISKHGKNEYVVITMEQYRHLTEKQETLVDFLRNSPLCGVEIDAERDKSHSRKVKF